MTEECLIAVAAIMYSFDLFNLNLSQKSMKSFVLLPWN